MEGECLLLDDQEEPLLAGTHYHSPIIRTASWTSLHRMCLGRLRAPISGSKLVQPMDTFHTIHLLQLVETVIWFILKPTVHTFVESSGVGGAFPGLAEYSCPHHLITTTTGYFYLAVSSPSVAGASYCEAQRNEDCARIMPRTLE